MEIFIIVYIVSLLICLPMRKGEFFLFAFLPFINVLFAIVAVFGYVHDILTRPEQLREYHRQEVRVRMLLTENDALGAKAALDSIRCPKSMEIAFASLSEDVRAAVRIDTERKESEQEQQRRKQKAEANTRQLDQEKRERAERQRLSALAQSGQILDSLSHQEFELVVLEAFARQGFTVKHTSFSGDEGIDGILLKDGKKIAIQCKKYAGTVGQPALRDFLGAMIHSQCNEGIFITTSDFSDPARSFVAAKSIRLFDRNATLMLFRGAFDKDYVVNGRTINFSDLPNQAL